MITVFHNTRCSKSREGLALVKASGQPFQIRDYSKELFTKQELKTLLHALGMKPLEIVRRNEKIWKEKYQNRDLSDDQLIGILIQHPSLIQRPLVEKDGRAVVGRPSENISELLK